MRVKTFGLYCLLGSLLLAGPPTLSSAAQQITPPTAVSVGDSVQATLPEQPDDETIQEYVTDPLSNSVVRVFVSKQEFDTDSPWRKKGVDIHQLTGTVVSGGRVLVTANSILDSTYAEVSKFGESQRYELVPEFIDQEVNLALLKIRDPASAGHFEEAAIGGLLSLRTPVDVMGRQGGQLTRMHARVTDISMRKARTSSYDVASYLLDAAGPAPVSSEPVVRNNRLVGIVDEVGETSAYAIPASIIRHFLSDVNDVKYRGFATLGLETTPLVSPESRKFYEAKDAVGGARVTDIAALGPCGGLIQRNDVLLKVAGHELDDYGRYKHALWGRVSFKYLLNELHGGEKTSLTILRHGKVNTYSVELARHDSYQYLARPPHRLSGQDSYLIFGGIVFQELDRTYLESFGYVWKDSAPVDLVLAERRASRTGAAKSANVIVVSRVLADEFNQGYEDLANQIVEQVNGQKIDSLVDVKLALANAPVKKAGKSYAVIALADDGGQIVLGYDGIKAAHQRIAMKYGIDTPPSFFTPD